MVRTVLLIAAGLFVGSIVTCLLVGGEMASLDILTITTAASIVTTAISIVVGVVNYLLNSSYNRKKLELEKILAREKQLLDAIRGLGDDSAKVRGGVVAALLQRLETRKLQRGRLDLAEAAEWPTIINLLVNATRTEKETGIQKYVGDGLIKALDARVPDDNTEPDSPQSPLRPFDFQRAQFTDVWWPRVDARGVDFHRAVLDEAGMAKAFLSGAVFTKASLRGTVLAHAIMDGVNLFDAKLQGANLNGAKLAGANLTIADLTGADFNDETDFNSASFFGTKVTEEQAARLAAPPHHIDRNLLDIQDLT